MKSNMYALSVQQLNLHVGCEFNCVYCKPSFQNQLRRWAKTNCQLCYAYKPHTHLERMTDKLLKTRYMQFIFLCSSGDIAFCPTHKLQQIAEYTKKHTDRTFLLQSKQPATFNRVKFPDNMVLGTTVETDKNYFYKLANRIYEGNESRKIWNYQQISKAPSPTERVQQLMKLKHKAKMLTYEPLLDFTLDTMITYAEWIQPCMIWLGMDSRPKHNLLPEPSYNQVKELHWELARRGFVVILKTIRNAWWQR